MVVFLSMERKQINKRKNWQVKMGCLYKGMYELWVNPKKKLKQKHGYTSETEVMVKTVN